MATKSGSSLSDLLAAGVLQSVVQWIIEEKDEGKFYGFIRRRFPDAYPASIKAAIARGTQAYKAGTEINATSEGGGINLSNIPANPYRPAKYSKPRLRFQYRVTVQGGQVAGKDQFVTVFVQSGKQLSAAEVRQRAAQLAVNRYAEESDKDPYKLRPTIADVVPVIVSVERTY